MKSEIESLQWDVKRLQDVVKWLSTAIVELRADVKKEYRVSDRGTGYVIEEYTATDCSVLGYSRIYNPLNGEDMSFETESEAYDVIARLRKANG